MTTPRDTRAGVRVGAYGTGRTARLHLRVTPEEHAAYEAAAARVGTTVAEWVRDVLDAALEPEGV